MITKRKSKYKMKVTMPSTTRKEVEMRKWCTSTFGDGGRSKKLRWRFGWTQKDITFYFKNHPDATMFLLRWGHET